MDQHNLVLDSVSNQHFIRANGRTDATHPSLDGRSVMALVLCLTFKGCSAADDVTMVAKVRSRGPHGVGGLWGPDDIYDDDIKSECA